MSPNPQGAKSYAPFVIIGVVLAAVVLGVVLLSRTNNANTSAQPAENAQLSNTAAPPRTPQPGAPNPYARGGANAPVTLEEFSDFQCPACGGLDPALRRISKDYGARVRWVFRNFPLTTIHKYAFIAARAAEAAGLQGKFWEMHDMLYDNQKEWVDSPEPRDLFYNYAARLGLDVQKFKTDLERQDLADRIAADTNRGNSLGVRGTPTIYVNGRELMPGKLPTEEDIRHEIDATLNSAGK